MPGKGLVYIFHIIDIFLLWQVFLHITFLEYLIDHMLHLVLFEKLNGRLKGCEIPKFGHIYTIAVGVPDLG